MAQCPIISTPDLCTEYISKAPWYLDTGAPSLSHQRRVEQDSNSGINDWYDRGAKAGPAATKFRKGACENCGAMTHKRADCLERPRRRGAKFTGKTSRRMKSYRRHQLDLTPKGIVGMDMTPPSTERSMKSTRALKLSDNEPGKRRSTIVWLPTCQ